MNLLKRNKNFLFAPYPRLEFSFFSGRKCNRNLCIIAEEQICTFIFLFSIDFFIESMC